MTDCRLVLSKMHKVANALNFGLALDGHQFHIMYCKCDIYLDHACQLTASSTIYETAADAGGLLTVYCTDLLLFIGKT